VISAEQETALDKVESIETPRLVLRAPFYEDGEALHELLSDPEVCRYGPHEPLTDIADTYFTIVEWRERLAEGLRAYVIADRSRPNEIVGFISVSAEGEIAGAMSPTRAGGGLATEALEAMIETLSLGDAWTIIDAENMPLIHTLEKVGMVRERILPNHRVHPMLSSSPRDCVLLRQQI
jgi:RimJ/RimL family protein N-acetyltransferase